MKAVRALAVLIVICLFAPSCGEPPSSPGAPAAPPAAMPGLQAHHDRTRRPAGLLRCEDLPYATSTRTIGRDGGSIRVGPHVLTIPAGALDAPTRITMTAPRGRGVNEVSFEPEGLRFDRPASLTMSYANCNSRRRDVPKRIAYTDDDLDIRYYLASSDNSYSKKVTAKLDHFSRYVIAFSDYVIAW